MYHAWTASRRWLVLAVVIGTFLLPASSNADPLTSWTPGPNAALEDTYDGYIDVPAMNATVSPGGFMVSGWVVDKTADGWSGVDGVQVWLGSLGSGALLATASVGQSRPDVAAAEGNPFWGASGFAGFVPSEQLAAGPQTLSVYAHTPAKGWWYKQVNVTVAWPTPAIPSAAASKTLPIVVIQRPRDNEVVSTGADYQIAGYALDVNAKPGQGIGDSGIGQVQVYAGGQRDTGTFLGNADLGYDSPDAADLYGAQFATAGWRLTFRPTRFHTSTHLLFAYAVSAVNGQENLTQRYFNIRDNS